MKLTAQQVLQATNALGALSALKFPPREALTVIRNLAKLSAEAEKIEEVRKQLLNEHCKKDKDGNPVIKDDNYVIKDMAVFNKSILELFGSEIEIDLTLMNIESLPDEIEPQTLFGIEWIFAE